MTVRRVSYFMLGFVFLLATPACYTLLKHPRVKRGRVYVQIDSSQCTSCHFDSELELYHLPANRAIDEDDGWKAYYSTPRRHPVERMEEPASPVPLRD